MASFVWGRSPQEAFNNPYEYEANEQFSSEAFIIVNKFLNLLMEENMKFNINNVTLQKAEWMILTDSVDAVLEALYLLKRKKHRVAARIFRDVIENIDLLTFFKSGTDSSKEYLIKWFDGEFIPHRISRKHIKEIEGESARKRRAKYYQELSAFTHRTYSALKDSYFLGRGDKMVYDRKHESGSLVLPHTISAYYAVIGDIIIQLSKIMAKSEICTKSQIDEIWYKVLLSESVPRRFVEK